MKPCFLSTVNAVSLRMGMDESRGSELAVDNAGEKCSSIVMEVANG